MPIPVKRVIVAAGSGHLGQVLLPRLLAKGLEVSILSRHESNAAVPHGVRVIKTDYETASLVPQLKGQDVVISFLTGPAVMTQKALIDASVQAGITRFVPSEFGVDMDRPGALDALPYLRPKVAIRAHLQSYAERNEIEWSAFANGIFLDLSLELGSIGFHLPSKSATVWDDGKHACTFSTLPFLADALVSLLTDQAAWDKGRNAILHVGEMTATQNDLLELLQAQEHKWNVSHVDGQGRIVAARQKMAWGAPPMSWILDMLQHFMWGQDSQLSVSSAGDNTLLGLQSQSLAAIVRGVADGKP